MAASPYPTQVRVTWDADCAEVGVASLFELGVLERRGSTTLELQINSEARVNKIIAHLKNQGMKMKR